MQLLVIDKNHLHVWDLARDHFVARKRISQHPLLAIFKSSGKGEFGVVSAGAVDIWRVEQDLDYRIVLGGHTGPVVALHAVNGALVSRQTNYTPPGANLSVIHTYLSVSHANSLVIHANSSVIPANVVSHPCQFVNHPCRLVSHLCFGNDLCWSNTRLDWRVKFTVGPDFQK